MMHPIPESALYFAAMLLALIAGVLAAGIMGVAAVALLWCLA